MVVTKDLTITYLKPVRKPTMPITAVAQVVNRGWTAGYVTGEVLDCDDRLVAHAVGNFWTRTPGDGNIMTAPRWRSVSQGVSTRMDRIPDCNTASHCQQGTPIHVNRRIHLRRPSALAYV